MNIPTVLLFLKNANIITRPYERVRDGGGGGNVNLTYISKDKILYISIICGFQYPLSYEPILALMLYNDLYSVIFKHFNFCVVKIPHLHSLLLRLLCLSLKSAVKR